MPRSGTTLIEQILSSHSQIHGAGELDFLPKIIDNLGIKKPGNVESFFTEIRNSYYDQIKRISDDNYIIDKLPANYKWIGFIINAFPESKIIHIERNPMAVCWSNYKTSFIDSGMDFNLSQQDIAKYYSLYLDTINFWKSKYSKKIFDVNYENFVNDFETNSNEILNFLSSDEGVYSTIDVFKFNDKDTMPGNTKKRLESSKVIKVNTISLNDLIKKYFNDSAPSYISVDTEGSEYDILFNLDLHKYKPKVFTVEHNYTNNEKKIDELMGLNGFKRVFKNLTFFDAWYVSKEIMDKFIK